MNMTKKQRLVGTAVLLTAIIGLIFVWPAGPSYHGQSTGKWFYRVWWDAPFEPDIGKEAVRALGPKAVPFRVSRLEAAPSAKVKFWLSEVSETARAIAPSARVKGFLSGVLFDGNEVYRQRKEMWQGRAAYLLGEMGRRQKARKAI